MLQIFLTGIASSQKTWSNSVTTGHYRRRSRKKSYPRMPSDFSSCDATKRVDNNLAAGVSENRITMYRKRHPRMFLSGGPVRNSPGFHFDRLSVASPVVPPLKACANDGFHGVG